MEKILIIQMCRMGDMVQTMPLLKRLKEENKGCSTTLMCIRESMQLIQSSPLVDCFVALSERHYSSTRKRIEEEPSLVTSLWDFPPLYSDYDLVINLTHDLGSAVLCDLAAGKRKSGRIRSCENEVRVAGDWAKYLFAGVRNRTKNLFNLVDIHVGMGYVPHRPIKGWLAAEDKEDEKGGAILKAHGHKAKGPLIAFQIGANELHRAWPVQDFAELARQLNRCSDAEIVLLGSSKEQGLGQDFMRQVDFPVVNLIGQTQVTELPAILKSCSFLVSNDTGTAHIAAAVGTRVLGLYFSTAYWGETAPYGEDNIVLQVEVPCSPCLHSDRCQTIDCKRYLTEEAVRDAALMMLDGRVNHGFDHPHLSAYHSRFLSNGTLAYLPLSSPVSESYQTGFINRVVWETALGLAPDPAYIHDCLSRMQHLDLFQSKVSGCRQEYGLLGEQYRNALRLAHHIIAECSREPLHKDRISSLNNALLAIQEDIGKLPLSLMQCYEMCEFMDMDYLSHPQMAHQLVEKYSRLQNIAGQAARMLETF